MSYNQEIRYIVRKFRNSLLQTNSCVREKTTYSIFLTKKYNRSISDFVSFYKF